MIVHFNQYLKILSGDFVVCCRHQQSIISHCYRTCQHDLLTCGPLHDFMWRTQLVIVCEFGSNEVKLKETCLLAMLSVRNLA